MAVFTAKLRLVLAELARPGAQRDDWFGWAAGQLELSSVSISATQSVTITAFTITDANA